MHAPEAWLKISTEDLNVAKILLKAEFFSPATYHCQQSAEKSLKAYLVFKKQSQIKTHDLVRLIDLCLKYDKSFEKVFEAAFRLNPFSTKFRYPTEFDVPDRTATLAAIKAAKMVLTFVVAKIEVKETGQTDLFKAE